MQFRYSQNISTEEAHLLILGTRRLSQYDVREKTGEANSHEIVCVALRFGELHGVHALAYTLSLGSTVESERLLFHTSVPMQDAELYQGHLARLSKPPKENLPFVHGGKLRYH